MRMFLIFISLYCFLGSLNLLDRLADRSFYLQSFCSDLFGDVTSFPVLASAFACGTPIHELSQKEIFLQTGLIHVMVVSGSHLIFVSQLCSFLLGSQKNRPSAQLLLALILMTYSLITGFQAPVVRSLVGILMSQFSKFFRWGWGSLHVQLVTGLFILSINPAWIENFSFFLSWFAASGLPWAPLFLRRPQVSERRLWHFLTPHALTCVVIQFFIYLLTQTFSWVSLGANLLIAPLIGVLLFPLLMINLVFPSFRILTDAFWEYLLQLLAWILEVFPEDTASFSLKPRWLLLAAVIAIQLFLRKRRYENSFQ